MINIVKTKGSCTFYEGRKTTTMDNAETIAAILRAFDHAGINYKIIEDDDGEKTKNGTIKDLFDL